MILDHYHQLVGTIIHPDRWTETVRHLGVTSRLLHPRQRERELAVHHLTAHVAHILLGAHPLANKARDATEVPHLRIEAVFLDEVLLAVALLGGDHLVDADEIVVGTIAVVLIIKGRAGRNPPDGVKNLIHHQRDVLAR